MNLKKLIKRVTFIITTVVILKYLDMALGAPACPRSFKIFQPNGIYFNANNVGDEHNNWTIETETGRIVLKDTSGYWYYATLIQDSSNKIPVISCSTLKVGIDNSSQNLTPLTLEEWLKFNKPKR